MGPERAELIRDIQAVERETFVACEQRDALQIAERLRQLASRAERLAEILPANNPTTMIPPGDRWPVEI